LSRGVVRTPKSGGGAPRISDMLDGGLTPPSPSQTEFKAASAVDFRPAPTAGKRASLVSQASAASSYGIPQVSVDGGTSDEDEEGADELGDLESLAGSEESMTTMYDGSSQTLASVTSSLQNWRLSRAEYVAAKSSGHKVNPFHVWTNSMLKRSSATVVPTSTRGGAEKTSPSTASVGPASRSPADTGTKAEPRVSMSSLGVSVDDTPINKETLVQLQLVPDSNTSIDSDDTVPASRRLGYVVVAVLLIPLMWAGFSALAAGVVYGLAVTDADDDLVLRLIGGGALIFLAALAGFQFAKADHFVLPILAIGGSVALEVYGVLYLLQQSEQGSDMAANFLIFLVSEQAAILILVSLFAITMAWMVRRTRDYLKRTHDTVFAMARVAPSLNAEFLSAITHLQRRFRGVRLNRMRKRRRAVNRWEALRYERNVMVAAGTLVVLICFFFALYVAYVFGGALTGAEARAWLVTAAATFIADTLLLQPLQILVKSVATFVILMRRGTERPNWARFWGKCVELLNRALCQMLILN